MWMSLPLGGQILPLPQRTCWSGSGVPQNALSTTPSISPVRVSSRVPAKPCFPLLSCQTVCQNFLEANQKSFAAASPNSLHTRIFASVTTKAAALLASRYLSAASGHPCANQARKASFCSLTTSITAGVHQWVLRSLSWQAPTTFWPQLLAAASTMEALKMVFVMANPWIAQKSENKAPLRFRSGRPFLPITPL